jgi:hypothetical protein
MTTDVLFYFFACQWMDWPLAAHPSPSMHALEKRATGIYFKIVYHFVFFTKNDHVFLNIFDIL